MLLDFGQEFDPVTPVCAVVTLYLVYHATAILMEADLPNWCRVLQILIFGRGVCELRHFFRKICYRNTNCQQNVE